MNINSQIKEMTFKEKLATMEVLWDELCHDTRDIESPAWHEDVLAKRTEIMESGNAEYITLDSIKKK